MYELSKIAITVVLVIAIAEIAKRDSLVGALVASIPIVSVLAMIWLYHDTRNVESVAELSKNIVWLVLPSLVLFISLPVFLKWHWPFYPALATATLLTVTAYALSLFARSLLTKS